MLTVDWGKAPADATHYSPPHPGIVAHWVKAERGQRYWMYVEGGKWNVDTSPRPLDECIARPAPWDGVSEPAVGTVLEARCSSGWHPATVFAVRKHAHGQTVVLFDTDTGWGCWTLGSEYLRPVLTAKQKAAQEREQAIAEMRLLMLRTDDSIQAAINLYDAGYRKVTDATES